MTGAGQRGYDNICRKPPSGLHSHQNNTHGHVNTTGTQFPRFHESLETWNPDCEPWHIVRTLTLGDLAKFRAARKMTELLSYFVAS